MAAESSIANSPVWDVLKFLFGFYPDYKMPEATRLGYVRMLSELPIDAVWQAAKEHVQHSAWFPKVSELYQPAREMAENAQGGRMTPEKAYEQVQYVMATKDDSEMDMTVYRAFRSVGGWWAFRTSENPGMLRAQFINAYKSFAQEAELQARTPKTLREAEHRKRVQEAQEQAARLMLGDGSEEDEDDER